MELFRCIIQELILTSTYGELVAQQDLHDTNLSDGVEDSYTSRDLIALEYSSGFWYYTGKTAYYSER